MPAPSTVAPTAANATIVHPFRIPPGENKALPHTANATPAPTARISTTSAVPTTHPLICDHPDSPSGLIPFNMSDSSSLV